MKLNKVCWEHLAPKSMVGRRREVKQMFEDFVRSSDYGGGEWARVAANPHVVFGLKPGHVIPAVRMIFMGDRPGFISPFRKLMDGHRTVDRKPEYGLGAQGEGELAIQPTISVEVITDPRTWLRPRSELRRLTKAPFGALALYFRCLRSFCYRPSSAPNAHMSSTSTSSALVRRTPTMGPFMLGCPPVAGKSAGPSTVARLRREVQCFSIADFEKSKRMGVSRTCATR